MPHGPSSSGFYFTPLHDATPHRPAVLCFFSGVLFALGSSTPSYFLIESLLRHYPASCSSNYASNALRRPTPKAPYTVGTSYDDTTFAINAVSFHPAPLRSTI